MKLGAPHTTTPETNHCEPLHLAPPARAVPLAKVPQPMDRGSRCDGFDPDDLADNLERHARLYATEAGTGLTLAFSKRPGSSGKKRRP